jgi:hypothetical protein
MSGGLPDPETVPDRAADLTGRTADLRADPAAVNVHVAPVDGGFDPATVGLGDGGYEGPNAGDLGRLAAAVAAIEAVGGVDPEGGTGGACLHHPEPSVPGADGPWLVVEPTAGRLSTVHAGRGELTVDLTAPPAGVDAGLRATGDALAEVVDAVRPDHEHYPVERDTEGVFTRGMTTLSLAGVDADGDGTTVRFDVSTTPDTTADAVEGLVSELSCVRGARYEAVVGLARGDPPSSLLRAAEAAAGRAVGDWEYEWYGGPTAFSDLSTASKLALGTGQPGAGVFGEEAYERCRSLLRGTAARYGGG